MSDGNDRYRAGSVESSQARLLRRQAEASRFLHRQEHPALYLCRHLCRHCGKPPEADGDHTCPCPYSDEECPNHA